MHLGGRLGAGRHLELDLDAVDGVGLARHLDVERRHDQGDLTRRPDLSQAAADLPLWTAVERRAVHVTRPPRHCRSGIDVFLYGVLGETLRRDDRDVARIDLALRRHTQHAAEVVGVAVRVDDGPDRTVTAVRAVQRQRRRRGLRGDQWVDDDDAGVTLDEADVRQVQAAHLIDARHHLVEALLGAQLRLPPQARMHGVRRFAVQEVVGVVVPHHSSVGRGDDARFHGGDEAAVGVLEVPGVRERERRGVGAVGGGNGVGGRLLLHADQPSVNYPAG